MSVQAEIDAIDSALRTQSWEQALQRAERLQRKHPNSMAAANALGVVAKKMGHPDKAVQHFERALKLSTRIDEQGTLLFNLAQCHIALGRLEQAIDCFRLALDKRPDDMGLLASYANVMRENGRTADAVRLLEQGLAQHPNHADCLLNLGVCHQENGQVDRARQCYEQLLAQEPAHAIALYNLGCMANEAGRLPEAQALLKRAVASAPDYLDAISMLLRISQQMCDWDTTEGLEQKAIEAVENGRAVFPFAFLSLPTTQAQQARCSALWYQRRYSQRQAMPALPAKDGQALPDSKIRLGFLSSDYHDHPTARLIVQVLELLDRRRFGVIGFSGGPDDGSALQTRVRKAFDAVVLINTLSDLQAAQCIREHRIDILIDLGGYTANSRSGVLAYRPANVQAQFLGFPGSLQMPAVDYLFTDQTVTPLDQLGQYSEKPAYLPDCYQCNDNTRAQQDGASRAQEGLPDQAIVLASLNQSYKIRRDLFACWCRILKACDNTVLWLLKFNDSAEVHLRAAALAQGVDPARLIFAAPAPAARHQARLALADIFLDTWQYNSHTTASDALWVRRPLVTLCGDSFPSRVATSILKAAHLDALVTHSPAQYEATVRRLIDDAQFARLIRHALQTPKAQWPLFDTQRWTRAFESLLLQMQARANRGESPAPLFAAPLEMEPTMNSVTEPVHTGGSAAAEPATPDTRRELLIGCGSNHSKKLCLNNQTDWHDLVTLDYNSDHGPDVVHDLTQLPLPFDDNHFDEIHAYEVLEHTGAQGDYRFFFAQFAEFWRILKPGGVLMATCPSRQSPWAWGDPSHTRVVQPENLIFLDQGEYLKQVGKTAMSDFRNIYSADFTTVFAQDDGMTFSFAIKAVKPSRHRRPVR